MGFRCFLSGEKLRILALAYYIPSDIEIALPRSWDRVLNPYIGFSTIYVGQLKVGLCLPLFSLIDILKHYSIALAIGPLHY